MTWDGLRDRRKRSDADDTAICRVDNLLRNQAEEIERLKAVVAGIDIDNDALHSKLVRARALNALAILVAGGGVIVACHPW